ncbi:MAG: hypothetical protein AAGA18_09740 [Verrucomicrobiota bacterium]
MSRLAKALLMFEEKNSSLKQAMKKLASLRPSVKIDAITGNPTFSINRTVDPIHSPDDLEECLYYIEKEIDYGNSIIVLDEFQDLLKLEKNRQILAVLRSKIQFLVKHSFVYLGSVRNDMDMLFLDPDSPFYKQAITLELGSLDAKQFRKFLMGKFAKGKREVDEGLVEEILQIADGVTGDAQELCSWLWRTEGTHLTSESLRKAMTMIFNERNSAYQLIMTQLPKVQRRVFMEMAKYKGNNVLGADFIKKSKAANYASVRRAVDALEQRRLLFRDKKGYRFFNPFIRMWLQSQEV